MFKLCVVVIAHNEADRISQSILSLREQTLSVEVMFVDNGSTDETCESVASQFGSHVSIFREPYEDISFSLTRAIKIALRESDASFFALLAGDDEWGPLTAESAICALSVPGAAQAVRLPCVWVDAGRNVLRRIPGQSFYFTSRLRRRLQLLITPYEMEIANALYGVFDRETFGDLAAILGSRAMQEHADDVAACFELIDRHPMGQVVEPPSDCYLARYDKGIDLPFERLGLIPPVSKSRGHRYRYALRLWWATHRSVLKALGNRRATKWAVAPQSLAGVLVEFGYQVAFQGRKAILHSIGSRIPDHNQSVGLPTADERSLTRQSGQFDRDPVSRTCWSGDQA